VDLSDSEKGVLLNLPVQPKAGKRNENWNRMQIFFLLGWVLRRFQAVL